MIPLWFAIVRTRFGSPGALSMAWATVLLHKGVTPFAVVFSLGLLAVHPFPRRYWGVIAALVLVFGLSGLGLNDHLRWADVHRIAWRPGAPGFWLLLHRASLPLSLKVEWLASLSAASYLAWRGRWMAMAFLLPTLVPADGKEVFGAGERWAVIYPMVLMAVAAFELGRLAPKVSASSWRRWAPVCGAALVIVSVSAFHCLAYAHPARLDPDYTVYEQIVKNLTNQDIPMLIAHRGLNFYYKYRLRRESFPFEPEDTWNHRRVWRLTYRITPAEMNYYLPASCRFGTGLVQMLSVPDYLLLREDCWDAFRDRVRLVDDDDLHARVFESWKNPSQKRPEFLYAKHAKDEVSEFPATTQGQPEQFR